MDNMETMFNKLKEGKKNSVDNLIKWIKDSNLIEETKAADEKTRKLFADVKDTTNVEFNKFKEAITKLAEEKQKTVEEFSKKLSQEGPKLITALTAALEDASTAVLAGASALKDAFAKK